ncbi:MAG: L,D-transpeptidase family protein [Paracoccaceae bacterium]|nr:L,D-transpeptidase family protein [Paracoccaceae bacterium]
MTTLGPKVATAAAIVMSALLVGPAGAQTSSQSETIVVAAPDTPFGQALATQFGSRGAEAGIRSFYESHAYQPLWLSKKGKATKAAEALITWAENADAHGLPAARYATEALRERLESARSGDPAGAAALEMALTRLFLTYGSDLSSGLIEPRSANRSINVKPRRPVPEELLASAAEASDMSTFLNSLAPNDPSYARLVAVYAEMRQIAASGDWGPLVPKGKTLRPGDRSARVPELRERLVATGDLAPEERVATGEVMNDATAPVSDPMVFDAALEAAVRRFQERHGLNTDGAVGPMTLAAVNTSAAERAKQVAVNLERMRWLNYDLGARHIFINTAAFTMVMMENGETRFATRAVVGKSARKYQTPEFIDELEYIVVNPYWNVPYSIASEEILPELQKNPFHLADNNMELLGTDLPASQIDWSQVTRGSFPGRIRQRPGAGNALGNVKFLFPNPYSIYMHDTPSRRLFARDRRAYSHGCVRLQDPIGFAHTLLSLQYADPVGTYDHLRSKNGEQWVTLDEKIPVYVSYRTTWQGDDGVYQFRADVYRRDRDVAAALAQAGVDLEN